jgi:hypothetical protein
MSRIPVSHKNRIRGETRDRIRSELNISESINSHINDSNNPHSVTKSQVGLSEVDNTSDANKPVSTAQQAALDLKEDISALGTAAYEDITISRTDTTAGRITKVGDFGLGGEVTICPNVDLNDVVVTGFYDISGATLNKPPTLSPTNAVCMTIVRTSDNMVQMVYNRRSPQIFQRYKNNNTWSSWTEVLTDNNFGKTEIDALNIDADTLDSLTSTQFLRSDVNGTINGNLTIGGSSVSGNEGGRFYFTKAPNSTHTNNPYIQSYQDVIRYVSYAGGTTRRLTLPAETGTVLHDTGDSSITGSFLADDPATAYNWNANWKTGFYEGPNAANAPSTGWYWGLKSGHSSNSATYRYGMDLVISMLTSRPYIRNANVDGAGPWQQIHTSANTNSYEFITNTIGERLLEGVGISTTQVDCPLPTSSFTYPASLTAVGGYELRDSRNGAWKGTNLLPVLSPLSTPKIAYARFTTTNIQIGKRYRIIASTANSKITVNF